MLMMGNNKYDEKQSGLKVLIKSYKKSNKKRDTLLISGVSIMVGLTFCIFSFLYGKLKIDILKYMREDGIAVSTYLANGTKEIEESIRRLSYVKNVGTEKFVGGLFANDQKICTCIVTDELTYERMIKPAYTDVDGSYPQKPNEIMLSQKTLKYLGINDPKVGMEIDLEFYWNSIFKQEMTGTQTFVLSGYYNDFHNSLSDKSIAYISMARCRKGNIELYPLRVLIDVKSKYLKGDQIEKILYQNILLNDNSQQFVGGDSAEYRAVESLAGGLGTAIVFIILICFSMFIFVYNILYISLHYDIRQYGLLEVIGVTHKQVKKLIYAQVFRIYIEGCAIGGGIGGIAVLWLLPGLLKKMYLGNEGNVNSISVFNIYFFVITIFLTAITILLATKIVVSKLLKMSPIEAMKGVKQVECRKERIREKEKKYNINPIFNLAFGNIKREKKKFVLSVLSLTIGCEIALGSCVMTLGTDSINKLSQNPDFEIGITQNAANNLLENNESSSTNRLLAESLISEMLVKCDLKNENLSKEYGFIPIYDESAQSVLGALNEYKNHIIIVQKIDHKEWEGLLKYIVNNEFIIDTKKFAEGSGTIVLHNHLVSQRNGIEKNDSIGKSISLYDIVPQGTKIKDMSSVQLQNCGYLDISDSAFPKLGLNWKGDYIIYLIVMEKGFNNMSNVLTKQLLNVDINVSKEKENDIKNILKHWVKEKNLEFQNDTEIQNLDLIYLICNSDVIASQKSYIVGSRIIMMSISLALLFIGVMNYSNTMVMNILTRKKEFVILESIGISRKQLRLMLTYEGLIYSLTIIGLLLTGGNVFLLLLAHHIQVKLDYFKFVYPFIPLLLITLTLTALCILIPWVAYGRQIKDSISVRIKEIE